MVPGCGRVLASQCFQLTRPVLGYFYSGGGWRSLAFRYELRQIEEGRIPEKEFAQSYHIRLCTASKFHEASGRVRDLPVLALSDALRQGGEDADADSGG